MDGMTTNTTLRGVLQWDLGRLWKLSLLLSIVWPWVYFRAIDKSLMRQLPFFTVGTRFASREIKIGVPFTPSFKGLVRRVEIVCGVWNCKCLNLSVFGSTQMVHAHPWLVGLFGRWLPRARIYKATRRLVRKAKLITWTQLSKLAFVYLARTDPHYHWCYYWTWICFRDWQCSMTRILGKTGISVWICQSWLKNVAKSLQRILAPQVR